MRRVLRAARRGYALLEVLIASIVVVVGFLAVFALQFAALDANVNAMRYTEATNLAEAWMGVLRRESIMWNQRGGIDLTVADMPNLTTGLVLPGAADTTGGWTVAAIHAGGNPVDKNLTTGAATSPGFIYCIHQRLTWMDVRDSSNLFSAELLRAEVRILWPRNERGTLNTTTDYSDCGATAGAENMGNDLANISSITVPGSVGMTPVL